MEEVWTIEGNPAMCSCAKNEKTLERSYSSVRTLLVKLLFVYLCLLSISSTHALRMSSSTPPLELSSSPRNCSVAACTGDLIQYTCGSDGKTYRSLCHMQRANACHPNKQIIFKHRGKCKSSRCQAEKANKLKMARESRLNVYIPHCLADGSYSKIQCHKATQYCWCVGEDGRFIPGSSIAQKKGKPRCSNRGKVRRGSTRWRKDKKKKGCSQSDRSAFNGHLIKILMTEFTGPSQGGSLQSSAKSDKKVIEWKFSQLDANSDNYLNKKEYAQLRKMAKKVVKPRRCAKTFTKYCDMDRDKRISRKEWSTCLGVDINISFRLFLSLNSDEHRTSQRTSKHRSGHRSRSPRPAPLSAPQPSFSLFRPVSGGGGGMGLREHNPNEKKQKEPVGCLADRTTALSNVQLGTRGLYVPECLDSGRYEQIQCYSSTGYCWCVDQETGRPIAGTSVKNEEPDCKNVLPVMRPIRGCREKKKKRFLVELLDVLTRDMVQAANSQSGSNNAFLQSEMDPDATLEERAARLKFIGLDKNINRVLDRKEWKNFRKWVSTYDTLKRCGKRLPRYCDINNDKKITVDEWIKCLGVDKESMKQAKAEETRKKNTPSRPVKRRGPNPLCIYLKCD